MIKAYFFDWMGTLGEASGGFDIKEKFGRDYHRELLVKKLEDVDALEKDKIETASMLRDSTLWLYPESQKLISELKPNYKLAIISNIYGITEQKIRETFPSLLSNFDVITFSSEVGLRKPDPRIFTYTLNKLNMIYNENIQPNEVVMVGDKKDKDIDPPIELGMNAILINRDNGSTLEDVLIKRHQKNKKNQK